jgi:hypothetical protein
MCSNDEILSLYILYSAYIVAVTLVWRVWALQASGEYLNSEDYEIQPFTEQISHK